MDHFTKYIWFYPLKQKSNVHGIFVRFKALVKNYFKETIVIVYSDQRGGYQALKYFLALHGISHFITLHIHLSTISILNIVIVTLWEQSFLSFHMLIGPMHFKQMFTFSIVFPLLHFNYSLRMLNSLVNLPTMVNSKASCVSANHDFDLILLIN